jgi:hypothetical protein
VGGDSKRFLGTWPYVENNKKFTQAKYRVSIIGLTLISIQQLHPSNHLYYFYPKVKSPAVEIVYFAYLARHTADVVVVVPRKLCASRDVLVGKECDPWEPQVVGVDKYILYKHVRAARML